MADRKSIPLTYRCILVVGKKLYPCEARYCANMMSVDGLFSWCALQHTCIPNTSNPNSIASVLENILTATPPSKPVFTDTLAMLLSKNPPIVYPRFLLQSPCSFPQFPPKNSNCDISRTRYTAGANLPVGLGIGLSVLEDGHLGIARVGLEALGNGGQGRRAWSFA